MKTSFLSLLAIPLLASCVSRPPGTPAAPTWDLPPAVANAQELTQPQLGQWKESRPLTRTTFAEVTIALGSGWDGFDSFRIFSDGAGYAVVRKSGTETVKIPFRISSDQLSGLIKAVNSCKPGNIQGLYSAGVADGTQGFIEIQSKSGGRVFVWMDNSFQTAAGLYAFARQELWPMLKDLVAQDWGGAGADAMEEYQRVFGETRF
jgi:hypothetical protein